MVWDALLGLNLSNALTVLLNLGVGSLIVSQVLDQRKRRRELRVVALDRAMRMLCDAVSKITTVGEEINWEGVREPSGTKSNAFERVLRILIEIRETTKILLTSSFEVWAGPKEKTILKEVIRLCQESIERLGRVVTGTDEKHPGTDHLNREPVLEEFRHNIEEQLAELASQMKRSL